MSWKSCNVFIFVTRCRPVSQTTLPAFYQCEYRARSTPIAPQSAWRPVPPICRRVSVKFVIIGDGCCVHSALVHLVDKRILRFRDLDDLFDETGTNL